MSIRCGLLASLASVLLAFYHGSPWLTWLEFQGLSAALVCGLAGRVIAVRARRPRAWQIFWLALVVIVWVVLTCLSLVARLAPLDGFPGAAITVARPYAISTTLLLGSALLLLRALRVGRSTVLPLLLLYPLWVALVTAWNPAGEGMAWLPVLVATGSPLSLSSSDEPTAVPSWQAGPAELIEMASLQCVAWGLLLALLSFSFELAHRDWVGALVMGSGTGVMAWLLSGLIWGLAQAFRTERIPAARLARFVFGPSSV